MFNPFTTSFAAVFRTEVLLNSKRLAPYVLIVLFTAHSVLWWGWSAAATFGWATNGDFNIVRNLQGFSFLLGLPIFNAVIMGDAVIKDFRLGVDQLLFSKPVGRASYLYGKFFGNFFVLVCCQSAFVLTMFLLQWVPFSRLVVQTPRVVPYFKHFFFFVVLSHLLLAVVYFVAGTLTRNVKVVYGLAVAFYPLYIGWQVFAHTVLPARWRTIIDPMLLGTISVPREKWTDAAWINQIVVSYSWDMLLNRGLVIIAAIAGLAFLVSRFSIAPRTDGRVFTSLNLSAPAQTIEFDRNFFNQPTLLPEKSAPRLTSQVAWPLLSLTNIGIAATLRKISAAMRIELHLLRAERSLVVLVPLTILLSFLALPFSSDATQTSPSLAFAGDTARGLLIFLLGVIVFYTGEEVYRDRELRIEPLLWSAPAGNTVFLLSKMMSTLLLVLFLVFLMGLTALITQALRGQTPIEVVAYLKVYGVILIPSLMFVTAAATALSVLLREKYLSYAVMIAISGGLFYLYTQGYNHWLYNPTLFGLWNDSDLQPGAGNFSNLVMLRGYTLALALLFGLLAHLFFRRPTNRVRRVRHYAVGRS